MTTTATDPRSDRGPGDGPLPAGDRYILISADCHAGANHETYRAYLEERYLDDFDAWRGEYSNPFRDLQGDGRSRNWDDERRIREQEEDGGVVAEVVFPNTVPPFFPTAMHIARPPAPEEYEHRLAGIRAHNRWLVDFCATHPERRAGIGQIFVNDLDDAIEDVKWIKEHGLRGGVLLPSIPPDVTHYIPPLYSGSYDKLWAVCQDLGVVVNQHSGTGTPDYGPEPAGGVVWLTETAFFSQRSLTHMLAGGAFDRFPGLRFVLTEQGCSWIPNAIAQLDFFHDMMLKTGRVGELKFTPEQITPMKPSEYFARNVRVGVSFPSPREAKAREFIGTANFMWGSDYPHNESTFPHTREGLRLAFAGTDPIELQQVLAGNAAELYDFDLDALAPLAAAVGPTIAEIDEPLETRPRHPSPAFTRR
jgi:predicted TIM-barrel fold metal-dependent hydrolase